MTALQLADVSLDMQGQVLLAPVSAQVATGECLAVTGANGTGKTTLLRIVTGLLQPSTGSVTLDGAPVDERSAVQRAKISALIGTPALYPDMTVAEHLELICATWRSPSRRTRQRVDGMLSRFELVALRDRYAHELSSGQLQLFCIAQVLVRPFSVLVLDEPEQRLDGHRRLLIAETICRAKHDGAAVVLASHSGELVDEVADKRLMLDAG